MPTTTDPTPPPGPRWSPLGSIPAFKRDILRAMHDGWQEHGDLVRYRLGPVSVYGVSSPELAEAVLTDVATYGKLGPDNPLRLVLGDGLLTSSDHDSWLRNRRMVQPVFHRHRLAAMFDRMATSTEAMCERIDALYRPGDTLDLHEELMRVTLDIVSQCMFSANVLDDLEVIGPQAVEVAIDYAFQRLQNPFSPPPGWPTPRNRRFQAVMTALDDLVYGIIDERRRMGSGRGDLLDMLLEATDADTGERMSDRQLRDEVITMFAAGHETTAITLTWTLYLLAQHPEVLRRVQDEVDGVLGGRTPALDDLPALPFTLQVFEEAMRLYPSAPILPRLVAEDTVLGAHQVPRGARVLVNLYNIHRHPRHWPDAERFAPERFAPEARRGRHRFANIPFGAGSHLCVGKHFALMEAHLLLAGLVQRVELRHLPSHRVVNHATITLRPRYGMLMTVQPRRRNRMALEAS